MEECPVRVIPRKGKAKQKVFNVPEMQSPKPKRKYIKKAIKFFKDKLQERLKFRREKSKEPEE